jgi:ABC-type phosphate transport system substrate-binding protein
MNIRTRLALTSTVLVVGAVTSACGGGSGSGAPTDASKDDFCKSYTELFTSMVGDGTSVPSNDEMAKAVKDWASALEETGTPSDISDDARAGFEDLIEQANDIDAEDFSIDKLEELAQGGNEASEEAKKQATAFATYLTDTCGNPLDNLDLPEMPSSTE